jgi:arabinofuranosyltransferase
MRRSSFWSVLGLCLFHLGVIVFGCVLAERTYHFGIHGFDDANIFFRYARHLRLGLGFVYSPGGESVEGFTSALWLVLCTYAQLVGSHADQALFAANVALAAASMVLITRVVAAELRGIGLGDTTIPVAGLVAAIALVHPAWIIWNVISLMDAGLYAFCITLGYFSLQLLREGRPEAPRALSWAAGLLVLCRPEGAGWLFLLWLGARIVSRDGADPDLARRARRCIVIAGGSTLASLLLWRGLTFRALLPNPLYAKVAAPRNETMVRGAEYLLSYVRLHPLLLGLSFLLPVALWLLRRSGRQSSARCSVTGDQLGRVELSSILLPLGWVLCGWSIPVMAGGDAFGGHRFCQAVALLLIPPLAFGIGMLVLRLNTLPWRALTWGIAVLLPLGALPAHWTRFMASNGPDGAVVEPSDQLSSGFWIASADRVHGVGIASLLAEHPPRIGYAAAGGISVGYPGTIYDLMGLNDPVLAHSCADKRGPTGHACFDRDRFYVLLPDALLPRATPRDQQVNLAGLDAEFRRYGNWDNVIFRDLFSELHFREQYRMARISRPDNPWAVHGYFSVPYLLTLAEDTRLRLVLP